MSQEQQHIPSFNPAPVLREDGGTDYMMEECTGTCYYTDNCGMYVGQCPCLVINLYGMKCVKKQST